VGLSELIVRLGHGAVASCFPKTRASWDGVTETAQACVIAQRSEPGLRQGAAEFKSLHEEFQAVAELVVAERSRRESAILLLSEGRGPAIHAVLPTSPGLWGSPTPAVGTTRTAPPGAALPAAATQHGSGYAPAAQAYGRGPAPAAQPSSSRSCPSCFAELRPTEI